MRVCINCSSHLCICRFAKVRSDAGLKAHASRDPSKDRKLSIMAAIVTDELIRAAFESSRTWKPEGTWGEAPVRRVLVSVVE